MWLIAGLGNIGKQHENNRHNVGFRAIDEIYASYNFNGWQKKLNSEIAKGRINSENVILVKPQTYLNDSGKSILAVSKFFKIVPSRIIVLHDELDLSAGKVKTKVGGGAAGHNGLRSIDSHIGKEYRRIRIGIQHPSPQAKDGGKVLSYVLGDFSSDDEKWLEPLLKNISQHITLLLSEGNISGNINDIGSKFIQALEI